MNRAFNLDLSRIDVVDFLNELGLRNVEDKGLEVFYSCPFPGHNHEDQTPSASMQQGSTVAFCFSCGWKGNALQFLSDYEGVSPVIAARWIRERFGDDFKEPEGKFLDEIIAIIEGPEKHPEKTESLLNEIEATKRFVDWYDNPVTYMIDRGFNPGILTDYGVGYDSISGRVTIPYRTPTGGLIGFKGRAIDPEVQPKYLVLGGPEHGFAPFSVGKYLFGLDLAIKTPEYKSRNHLNLVEGELNCIAMVQKGYPNTVGISGKFISETQRQLLVKHCGGATFIFDELADSYNAADKLMPNLNVKIVPDHDTDPADMNTKDLQTLMIGAESPIKFALRMMQ